MIGGACKGNDVSQTGAGATQAKFTASRETALKIWGGIFLKREYEIGSRQEGAILS